MSYWRARLPVSKPAANYQMNLTLIGGDGNERRRHRQRASSLAVYGRKGGVPSVTRYDWAHIVTDVGRQISYVNKRSVGDLDGSVITIDKAMSRGDWFIAVLNDDEDGEARTVRAVVGENRRRVGGGGMTTRRPLNAPPSSSCPDDCGGRGECGKDGRCRCRPGFSGRDCSLSKWTLMRLFFFPRTFGSVCKSGMSRYFYEEAIQYSRPLTDCYSELLTCSYWAFPYSANVPKVYGHRTHVDNSREKELDSEEERSEGWVGAFLLFLSPSLCLLFPPSALSPFVFIAPD